MSDALLRLRAVSKSFGGLPVMHGVDRSRSRRASAG